MFIPLWPSTYLTHRLSLFFITRHFTAYSLLPNHCYPPYTVSLSPIRPLVHLTSTAPATVFPFCGPPCGGYLVPSSYMSRAPNTGPSRASTPGLERRYTRTASVRTPPPIEKPRIPRRHESLIELARQPREPGPWDDYSKEDILTQILREERATREYRKYLKQQKQKQKEKKRNEEEKYKAWKEHQQRRKKAARRKQQEQKKATKEEQEQKKAAKEKKRTSEVAEPPLSSGNNTPTSPTPPDSAYAEGTYDLASAEQNDRDVQGHEAREECVRGEGHGARADSPPDPASHGGKGLRGLFGKHKGKSTR